MLISSDVHLSSDVLSQRSLQNIQMLKFRVQLDIQDSVEGYLWTCAQSRLNLFEAFLQSELGTLPNSHFRLVIG